MTDQDQHEIRAHPQTELEDAEEELKHLREEANQAADSISKVGVNLNAVTRLIDKLKVTRQKLSILREAKSEVGLGSPSSRNQDTSTMSR